MELSSLIIDLLDGKKTSTSHKFAFNSIDLLIANENVNGYSLSFFVSEGSGRLGEF